MATGFRNMVFIILVAIGALYVLVTVTPVTAWWARTLAGPWNDPGGDVLVLLGADTRNAGIIGYGSYLRAQYGILAWRAGHFHTMVISGGADIGSSIGRFVVCEGIPSSSIRIESQSTSTRENALFTRDLLKGLAGRKVLLTSDVHMYRAVRTFRKAGVDIAPYPYPDALKRYNDWTNRWPIFLELLGETAKIIGYRLRGWI